MQGNFATSFAHQARRYAHHTPGADIRDLCAQNAKVGCFFLSWSISSP